MRSLLVRKTHLQRDEFLFVLARSTREVDKRSQRIVDQNRILAVLIEGTENVLQDRLIALACEKDEMRKQEFIHPSNCAHSCEHTASR